VSGSAEGVVGGAGVAAHQQEQPNIVALADHPQDAELGRGDDLRVRSIGAGSGMIRSGDLANEPFACVGILLRNFAKKDFQHLIIQVQRQGGSR
jgi:hypothetical protein